MKEFPGPVVEPLVTVMTYSLEAVGPGMRGMNATSYMVTASVAYPAANLALFIPFTLTKSIVMVKLFAVNGNPCAGNIDVGIYDVAGRRIISSGSVAHALINNVQVFDIADTRIGPGNFYLAVAKDDAVGCLRAGTTFANIAPALLGMAQMAAAFPLPAQAVFAQITGNYVPVIGLSTRVVL